MPAKAPGPASSQPAGETKAPVNPPGVLAQGDSVPALDTTQRPGQTKVKYDPEQEEQKFRNANPFGAPPGTTRDIAPEPDTLRPADVRQELERRRKILDTDLAKAAIEGARIGIKPAEIRAGAAHKQKQFDAMQKDMLDGVKAQGAEQNRRDTEERAALRPRDIPIGQEETFAGTIASRTDQLAAEAQRNFRSMGPEKIASDKRARDQASSVLRWAVDPRDKETLNRVATGIWRHNKGSNTNNSVDDAVTLTSILRPLPDGKPAVGLNRNTGSKATQFVRMPDDPNRNVVLQLPSGRTIRMDQNNYRDLLSLHQQNWKQYEDETAKAKQSTVVDEKAKQGVETIFPTTKRRGLSKMANMLM